MRIPSKPAGLDLNSSSCRDGGEQCATIELEYLPIELVENIFGHLDIRRLPICCPVPFKKDSVDVRLGKLSVTVRDKQSWDSRRWD
ncbi:hypothetical protein JAAARDRAFT_287738 [Jaapia argillacea MUCL 33604]|uniref:F-box domain-containing protein n=1 Tax=Jaapia argillacea MUCL 33604 TaxID=933084 RepID=A0A067Q3M8_9AGAM|nr:hypothetical protein JAAARDRAFT_287738 [Jaapia argillacea MUCL 33604]